MDFRFVSTLKSTVVQVYVISVVTSASSSSMYSCSRRRSDGKLECSWFLLYRETAYLEESGNINNSVS